MLKIAHFIRTVGFLLLIIWITILVISFGLNYTVTSDNIMDDLVVITQDTTISKWIDVDKVYTLNFKDKKVEFHTGITFIPSENSLYMKTLKKIKDDSK